jgi:hypothetical protein
LAAKQNLESWWRYEIQTDVEAQRELRDVYDDAVSVCIALNQGAKQPTVLRNLETTFGYTGGGAAALFKSAISALCTQHDHGYKTYFDQNVLRVKSAIESRTQFTTQPPTEFDYGFLSKYACHYLSTMRTSNGLWEYLTIRYRNDLYLMRTGNDTWSQIFIVEAVRGNCNSFFSWLPPLWINAAAR